MSFSFDTSLSSFKDKVRLLINDVVELDAAFSNEEIAAYEQMESNVYLAAAELCRVIGLKYARRAIKFDTSSDARGGLLISRETQPKWWFLRADHLTTLAMTQGVDEIIEHYAFDIDVNGRDRSQYQGREDCVDL